MEMTKDDKESLCQWLYAMYNAKYFHYQCPKVIKFKFKDWKRYAGKANKHEIELANSLFERPFNESEPIILCGECVGIMNLQSVLVHEMIHVLLDSQGYLRLARKKNHHGRRFQSYENQIMARQNPSHIAYYLATVMVE